MRTFEEIHAELEMAYSVNDANALRDLARELQAMSTDRAEAIALNALGSAEMLVGNYASALEHYRRALAEYEALGRRGGMAFVLGNMGSVYQNIGDYPSALEHTRRALDIHEGLGDRAGVALATGNLGVVYRATGDASSALEHYQRAQQLYEELGHRADAARLSGNIGNVYAIIGDHESAMEYYRRALVVHRELGDHYNEAVVTGNMIETLLGVNNFAEAAKLLDKQAAMPMDDPATRASHERYRARIVEHAGDLGAAHANLLKALQIATEAGLRDITAECHKELRDLAQKRNDFAGYIEHNAEYLRIAEEIRGKEATQRMAMMEADRKAQAVEQERVKERALLYGALPESVATRMLRGEDVSGDHYENVSVLFLDIVGFTSISDRIPAGHVVHLLKAIFRVCDDVSRAHGLTKIKTIGDSYLAVAFPETGDQRAETGDQRPETGDQRAETGDQRPETHHARRAAHAALAMLRGLNALELTMDPALGDTAWTQDVGEICVRIGLHCGPVVAGVVGDERLQYDVWGDTVNVASRMESTGEPGRIQMSEAFTTSLTASADEGSLRTADLMVSERGEVSIKGKGAMKTFWLEGA